MPLIMIYFWDRTTVYLQQAVSPTKQPNGDIHVGGTFHDVTITLQRDTIVHRKSVIISTSLSGNDAHAGLVVRHWRQQKTILVILAYLRLMHHVVVAWLSV